MGRIRLLSDELINQIAAGEVVERPASVVKELAENSVDAQARTVRVLLAEGGLARLSIIDDGHGMSREDAVLSLERHATSKLADAEGLFHIVTKGFRGEALPSIASVSRFTLTTSEPEAVVGSRVSIEGGSTPVVEDAPAAGGTRIDVDELFFNVPARRKFLKRESTELTHCEEAVVRLALAHPEVGFFLEHGGRTLISSPATNDPKERIGALLGAEVLPHLLAIEERRLGVAISGFIASPEFTLPTARGLYTFLNRRYVRDRGINSAVQRAFQDSMPPGRQPVATIFIEVDPRAVDVNVHPQKLEVRFADPRSVQEALAAAIGRALKAAPWRAGVEAASAQVNAEYALAVERFLNQAQQGSHPFVTTSAALPMAADAGSAFGTARPSINEAPPPKFFSSLRFVGELAQRLWLCEGPGGTLVILDPRVASERLTLESLRRRLQSGALADAPAGLFSMTLELDAERCEQVLAHQSAWSSLGFDFAAFGGTTLALTRVPAGFEHLGAAQTVEIINKINTPDDVESALATLANELTRLEPGRTRTHAEIRAMLEGLDEVDFSAPNRPLRLVVRELPLLELLPSAAI